MAGRVAPLRLVIFDCDGVIVDSEGIANHVVAERLTRLGWAMTPEEANHIFLGMSLDDMIPVIAARLGRVVPEDFEATLVSGILVELERSVGAIAGAREALRNLTAAGMPWRVASNSSHAEMTVKFRALGISELVAGLTHSFTDVARGKPAPDLFLATAAAAGVHPSDCVVIEDSVVGVRAAMAAGMDCLGYAPHDTASALRAAGAVPFGSMFDVPRYVALAARITV